MDILDLVDTLLMTRPRPSVFKSVLFIFEGIQFKGEIPGIIRRQIYKVLKHSSLPGNLFDRELTCSGEYILQMPSYHGKFFTNPELTFPVGCISSLRQWIYIN
jgi:hypothetical protein